MTTRILSHLNKKYAEKAKSGNEDALNLLVKKDHVFKVYALGDLKSLTHLNLLGYTFGVVISAAQFPGFVQMLRKKYNEFPGLLDMKYGVTIDHSRTSKIKSLLEQFKRTLSKTTSLTDNRLRQLNFKKIREDSAFSSSMLRVLLYANRDSLEHISLEYTADHLTRTETRILFEEIGLS